MFTIHRARVVVLAIAAGLAVAVVVPVAAQTEDQPLAAAPAAPSWDETSGYGSVETSRAISALPEAPASLTNQFPSDVRWAPALPAADLAWDGTSGYGAVEANRAALGPAGLAGGVEPTGHEVSAAIGFSWDETSGYGSVEASRAASSGK